MEPRPILLKVAKLLYVLLKPFLPTFQRYYAYYQNYRVRNLYHLGALSSRDMCYVGRKLNYKPLISVVVPVFNPNPVHFMEMVYSVINQHYPNWELVLVNGSSQAESRQQTNECLDIDTRIKVVELEANRGISANTNAGLKEAAGEYIAFGDHDDLLHPCALHSIVEALQQSDRPELLYTDEDKISDDGSHYLNPHIKPDWSIDTLRNVNFVNHLTVVRRDVLDKVKGLRNKTDGAQDYDLMLRIWDEFQPTIKHVPRILYHWRMARGSTADVVANKEYIFKSGTIALEDHLKRVKLAAKASYIEGKPGYYMVEYDPVSFSIVIGPVAALRQIACVAWLEELFKKCDKEKTELIIGDWYSKFHNKNDSGMRVKTVEGGKDYWQRALGSASYNIAVCFKAAAIPKDSYSLGAFAAAAADPGHTAISPMVINDNNVIVGGGLIQTNGTTKVLFEGEALGAYTWFLDTDWVRRVYDLTTEVIAAPTKYLKTVMSKGNYDTSARLGLFSTKEERKNSNFVVWSHTPFEYLGSLNPNKDLAYHSIDPFKYTSTTQVQIYNWWKDYERDEE